jgi:hypothetical protein
MAQAKARPKAKREEETVVSPDVSGLTPFERMSELSRRIIAVPKSEITAKAKRKKKRHF